MHLADRLLPSWSSLFAYVVFICKKSFFSCVLPSSKHTISNWLWDKPSGNFHHQEHFKAASKSRYIQQTVLKNREKPWHFSFLSNSEKLGSSTSCKRFWGDSILKLQKCLDFLDWNVNIPMTCSAEQGSCRSFIDFITAQGWFREHKQHQRWLAPSQSWLALIFYESMLFNGGQKRRKRLFPERAPHCYMY